MEIRYRAGEITVVVQVERRGEHYRVRVDGREHEVLVKRVAAEALDLILDGREVRALVARDGGRRFVRLDEDDPVTLERLPRGATARPAPAGGSGAEETLEAGMDGRVAAVLVREGDRVEKGATLVVLEAMKMEMRVVAPHRGRVRSLGCRVGEVVERGRVLVALDPEREGAGVEPAAALS